MKTAEVEEDSVAAEEAEDRVGDGDFNRSDSRLSPTSLYGS
jgi:hypothetical protein